MSTSQATRVCLPFTLCSFVQKATVSATVVRTTSEILSAIPLKRADEFANESEIHPVIQAAELHYNLVAVHPFADRNGRTARLMMNYHLLRKEYPLVIIPVENRSEYLAALDEANLGRTNSFSAFLLDCVQASFTKILGHD